MKLLRSAILILALVQAPLLYAEGLIISDQASSLTNREEPSQSGTTVETESTAERQGTAIFLTPSLSYQQLDAESKASGFDLDAYLLQLNLDFEVVGENFAFHRLRMGHTLRDRSEVTSQAGEDVEATQAHFAYHVGAMAHLGELGDVTLWTGLGWESLQLSRDPEGKTYQRYVYLPFGLDFGVRFDQSSFLVLGGEYRLLMHGWERYHGSSIARPTQANGGGYAVWAGLDYVAGNGRVLTSRFKMSNWSISESVADEVPDSRARTLGVELGLRF